jgi:glyoxylase-like metal-dependent hydrolase (beta-lactamase superfamily II)
LDVPMIGTLTVNAFLYMGEEPVLIDTGVTPERDEFLDAVHKLVDPRDLKWIWLTHADRDHTGAIADLLREAPDARVVCHFITLGLMGAGTEPIPPERAYLVRHGTRVPIGSEGVVAFRPPLFDNPGTVGFVDTRTGVVFCSDFLGAALPNHEDALVDDIAAVSASDVEAGQLLWGSVDAPWVHSVDEFKLAAALDEVRRFDASTVLSTHLPPIRVDVERHLSTIAKLVGSPPTTLPDQEAMEAAMAQIAHGA